MNAISMIENMKTVFLKELKHFFLIYTLYVELQNLVEIVDFIKTQ